jgi:hypothetical protein
MIKKIALPESELVVFLSPLENAQVVLSFALVQALEYLAKWPHATTTDSL